MYPPWWHERFTQFDCGINRNRQEAEGRRTPDRGDRPLRQRTPQAMETGVLTQAAGHRKEHDDRRRKSLTRGAGRKENAARNTNDQI